MIPEPLKSALTESMQTNVKIKCSDYLNILANEGLRLLFREGFNISDFSFDNELGLHTKHQEDTGAVFFYPEYILNITINYGNSQSGKARVFEHPK